uniref:ATP-binding protein n=1 Tax=Pseudomonas syringae group genomosp. 3 TaxID=251701 RepID=UPI001604D814
LLPTLYTAILFVQNLIHGRVEQHLVTLAEYPKEKWYDLFADPTIAYAIFDRIVHKSNTIELNGEWMRRIKSRKRT